MSNPNHREPRRLSDILGELFTVRGYSRLLARQELEAAWNAAVGEPLCQQTRLGEVRRGVLSVTVAHSTLLSELAAFRKPLLIKALRAGAPASTIHDIRFRVGAVTPEVNRPRERFVSECDGGGPDAVGRPASPRRSSPKGQSPRRHGSGRDPMKP
jgi:predicted nucleic acid-binding Zn ribbon protein